MAKKYTNDNHIFISEDLSLKKIKNEDYAALYALMQRIYPPAYIDFWKDDGEWYVNDLYNKENIKKELEEENAAYFFVNFKEVTNGIIRIVFETDTNYKKDVRYIKLHRLYLDQEIQNKGIGKIIMIWLIEYSTKKGYKKLWLEAMEKQHQAFHFYKKLGFIKVDKVIVEFPLLHDEYRGMYKMVKELK